MSATGGQGPQEVAATAFPPINYIYTHLHDSIRAELDTLARAVLHLQQAGASSGGAGLSSELSSLQERYRFLEQVYKYHSSVEDEVVYPALDSKVRNVTLAYSVEHEDEEHLFEQLFQLLSRALGEQQAGGKEQLATVRLLACKVEEIHTTLRKHLRKEEEQLLPLLLQHFSTAEQAQLVAQFLCSIPLSTVEHVLGWLKQQVPQQEQAALLVQLRQVVADRLLQQLLLAWLAPNTGSGSGGGGEGVAGAEDGRQQGLANGIAAAPGALPAAAGAGGVVGAEPMAVDGSERQQQGAAAAAQPPASGQAQPRIQNGRTTAARCSSGSGGGGCRVADEQFVCCRTGGVDGGKVPCGGGGGGSGGTVGAGPGGTAAKGGCLYDKDLEDAGFAPGSKPPLREIYYFHQAIRSALHNFAAEARALRAAEGRVTTAQLSALVERHRFIRAVCHFHSTSEDEIVFPALRLVRQQQQATQQAQRAAPAQKAQGGQQGSTAVGGDAAVAAAAAAAGMAGEAAAAAEGSGVGGEGVRRLVCEEDHEEESRKLEELGRLLGAVKAHARRGAKEVAALVCQLSDVADSLAKTMHRHMAKEEADVLPTLMRSLCMAQQRHMVWRILRAMPLRLLERVMPWVAGRLREEDVREWLANIRCAAPRHEAPLVELLCQWARRGKLIMPAADSIGGDGRGQRRSIDDPSFYSNQTCGPASFLLSSMSLADQAQQAQQQGAGGGGSGDLDDGSTGGGGGSGGGGWVLPADQLQGQWQGQQVAHQQQQQQQQGQGQGQGAGQGGQVEQVMPPHLKRIRTDAASDQLQQHHHHHHHHQKGHPHHHHHHHHAISAAAAAAAAAAGAPAVLPLSPHGVLLPGLSPRFDSLGSTPTTHESTAGGIKPIDHIFQFHKALRRELREIEATAVAFQEATEEATDMREFDGAIQELEAKFQFLRGIYRAHSKAEDEIVFPALEAKETLHNVSHAYTLDHKEEEQYFDELAAVLGHIRAARELPSLREHSAQLSRMCAAVRASLETHVRAEEQELWPLFAEHFSIAEQESLVGVIIGNTGAEVLTTMLSWVQGSMTQEEQEAMIASLKSASKSTAFEQWLGAVRSGGGGSPPAAGAAAAPGTAPAAAAAGGGAGVGGAGGAAAVPLSHQEEMAATLAEVAEYLAQQGIAGRAPADPGSIAADSSSFKPGWEDIFRMNQKQLEAAIRRVSADPSLEPQRKAYLRQNIMASHYIVTQQRRMHSQGSSTAATPTALAAAGMRDSLTLQPRQQQGQHPAGGVIAAAIATTQQQQQQQQQAASTAQQGQQTQAAAAAGPAAAAEQQVAQQAGQQQQQQQQERQHRTPAVPHYHDTAAGVLGCRHYRRRCMLVAPCCDTPYVCRLCHDEAADHQVDRYAVTEMVCMECATRQGVAASCRACGASMARYYCAICHLFDDEPGRHIYHCPFCNFCRQGRGLGVDSFHCMSCNACMSLELFNKHRCVEQSLAGNCPVCSDRLFESKHPVKESPCGHFMHSHCFAAYTRYSYTCPVCFKSLGDMSVYWKMIDSLLAAERLPPEYASQRQAILCNDCGQTGEAPFHFVYHKCSACSSYNTRVV